MIINVSLSLVLIVAIISYYFPLLSWFITFSLIAKYSYMNPFTKFEIDFGDLEISKQARCVYMCPEEDNYVVHF